MRRLLSVPCPRARDHSIIAWILSAPKLDSSRILFVPDAPSDAIDGPRRPPPGDSSQLHFEQFVGSLVSKYLQVDSLSSPEAICHCPSSGAHTAPFNIRNEQIRLLQCEFRPSPQGRKPSPRTDFQRTLLPNIGLLLLPLQTVRRELTTTSQGSVRYREDTTAFNQAIPSAPLQIRVKSDTAAQYTISERLSHTFGCRIELRQPGPIHTIERIQTQNRHKQT